MMDYDKLAGDVANMLNNFSFSEKEFCKAMTKSHRTLQQTFTRLCLEWVKTCADEGYRHDGRNEASHEVCQKLKKDCPEVFEGMVIPFV